jgi:hypothetical protein
MLSRERDQNTNARYALAWQYEELSEKEAKGPEFPTASLRKGVRQGHDSDPCFNVQKVREILHTNISHRHRSDPIRASKTASAGWWAPAS